MSGFAGPSPDGPSCTQQRGPRALGLPCEPPFRLTVNGHREQNKNSALEAPNVASPLRGPSRGHLVHHPTVTVECHDRRRCMEVQVEILRAWLRAWERVLDLGRNMRCDNCGAKGRAMVDARRALGYEGRFG